MKLGIYKHHKGNMYKVLFVAKHTETKEDLVVYEALYESEQRFWVRPLAMFVERVKVGGKRVPRFEFVKDI